MPFQMTQRTIKDMINDSRIDIPAHQRQYIWTEKQVNGFLITIMDCMPTLSLIMYEEVVNGKNVRWLEDGQQRFMSIKKFYNGELGSNVHWNNKKYAEFSQEEKTRFENYPLTITTMEDVPYERRVALFQAIQDGTPLTNGERFHAYSHSPLVKFAKKIMTEESCVAVWGPVKDDKKKKSLANAVAIASGLAFQNIDAITTSYDILGKNGFLEREFCEDEAMSRLDNLLGVYKRADELCPTTLTKKKPQWDAGKYTGYILYCMCLSARDWHADKEMFAEFIARVRRDKLAMKILCYKKPATRNWNSGRWKQGVDNLENIEHVEHLIGVSDDDENDDSE
jgi:hypothetical protein